MLLTTKDVLEQTKKEITEIKDLFSINDQLSIEESYELEGNEFSETIGVEEFNNDESYLVFAGFFGDDYARTINIGCKDGKVLFISFLEKGEQIYFHLYE